MGHTVELNCGMWNFTTDTKEDLSEHEKDFHKILNYKCKNCKKDFKFSSELDDHMQAKHKDGPATSQKRQTFSYQERKKNGFCRFWNHST